MVLAEEYRNLILHLSLKTWALPMIATSKRYQQIILIKLKIPFIFINLLSKSYYNNRVFKINAYYGLTEIGYAY